MKRVNEECDTDTPINPKRIKEVSDSEISISLDDDSESIPDSDAPDNFHALNVNKDP